MLLHTNFQAYQSMILQVVKNRRMWLVLALFVVVLLGAMFSMREVVTGIATDPWPLFAVPPHTLVTM